MTKERAQQLKKGNALFTADVVDAIEPGQMFSGISVTEWRVEGVTEKRITVRRRHKGTDRYGAAKYENATSILDYEPTDELAVAALFMRFDNAIRAAEEAVKARTTLAARVNETIEAWAQARGTNLMAVVWAKRHADAPAPTT